MKHPLQKILSCLLVGFIFSVPLLSRATEGSYSQLPIPGFSGFSDPPTIGELFNFAYGFALLLSGIFLFVSLFSVGWGFLTSGASPQKRRDATKKFTGAAAGTALLFGTFLVLRIVNPQLLTLSNQNFSVCYTPTAQELAQPPAVQKDDEKNRIAAGLPPNCTHIKGPSISLFAPFGSASSPASSSGSSSGAVGTTPPPGSASCSAVANPTGPAGNCAISNMEGGGFPSGVNAINASQICNRESGGNERDLNASCIHNAGCDYSVGIFQFNLAGNCGVGPGKAFSSYVCNTDRSGSCTIGNRGALLSCAQSYGVTLDLSSDPNGTIVGADTLQQVKVAHDTWSKGQGIGHPSFCGNHPADCSVCNLWSTAAASTCSICPN